MKRLLISEIVQISVMPLTSLLYFVSAAVSLRNLRKPDYPHGITVIRVLSSMTGVIVSVLYFFFHPVKYPEYVLSVCLFPIFVLMAGLSSSYVLKYAFQVFIIVISACHSIGLVCMASAFVFMMALLVLDCMVFYSKVISDIDSYSDRLSPKSAFSELADGMTRICTVIFASVAYISSCTQSLMFGCLFCISCTCLFFIFACTHIRLDKMNASIFAKDADSLPGMPYKEINALCENLKRFRAASLGFREPHEAGAGDVRIQGTRDHVLKTIFDRLMQYFDKEEAYTDGDLSVNMVARALYTNKSYLSRAVKQFTGMNFCQFVNSYRIRYSIRLFENDPSLKVGDLAQMSGFHSLASYNIAFRANMNESPSEWCRRYRFSDNEEK